MKWIDILKGTVTQSRVKEIEDIDIDIDDDDCLRWMNKLYQIVARYPDSIHNPKEIVNEEEACQVKRAWQEETYFRPYTKIPVPSDHPHSQYDEIYPPMVGYANFKKGEVKDDEVRFVVFDNRNSNYHPHTYFLDLSAEIKVEGRYISNVITLKIYDENILSRVVKEICNYLNLDYSPMLEVLI